MARRLRFYVFWPGLFIYFLIHNQRTRVVVRCRGEILLVRDSGRYGFDPNSWTLPGGGIGYGEEDTVAAVRELREELGILVEPDSLVALGERTVHGRGLRYQAQYFLIDIIRKPGLTLDAREIAAADWFSVDTISSLPLKPELATGLELLSVKK